MAVEAGRDEQPRRREALDDRRDDLVERLDVHVAGRAGRQRHVHRRPAPGTDARLGHPAGARVQRPLVEADEQHPRVLDEHRLGAVAVVGVVVEDPHALAGVGEGGGDDGDVGDEAEAHRVGRRGVVTGRAHGAERGVALALAQRLDRGQPGAGGEVGGRRRVRAQPGVGVDPPAAAGGHRLQPVEVPLGVHTSQVVALGGHRFERDDGVGEPGPLDAGDHRLQPRRPLGVARSGEVLEVGRVGGEQHRHSTSSLGGRDDPVGRAPPSTVVRR